MSSFAMIFVGVPASAASDGFVRPAIDPCPLRKAHHRGARCSTSSEEASLENAAHVSVGRSDEGDRDPGESEERKPQDRGES